MSKGFFKIIFILIVLSFLALFTTQVSGYYEYSNSQKTMLTNEAIKKFEEDLKQGKDISINDYVETTNYSNSLSQVALKISNNLQSLMDKSLKKMFSSIAQKLDE